MSTAGWSSTLGSGRAKTQETLPASTAWSTLVTSARSVTVMVPDCSKAWVRSFCSVTPPGVSVKKRVILPLACISKYSTYNDPPAEKTVPIFHELDVLKSDQFIAPKLVTA